MIGIYKIVKKENGKTYIGQSNDIERRIKEHQYKVDIPVELAIKKYGIDGTVVHEIRVNDGTSAPACTAEAISDHIGEFESAKGAEFTIEVTFDKPCASDKEKQAYEDLRDKVEAKPDNNITIILAIACALLDDYKI